MKQCSSTIDSAMAPELVVQGVKSLYDEA
ncbi:hypothetical protein FOXB_00103 [Fusarium oxysporum f. sp. conglutinans Fo5176]|uniref:Uncharacterized protein n=1 Tax=Fusarium oxysporum (strain Fo5176) TaxID=660025 RepID=F9F129_FUSOF|nr:hypothetical protein FOXB_00103 [Fusarium oxysporum f. sp. conglutinans Fo5176]